MKKLGVALIAVAGLAWMAGVALSAQSASAPPAVAEQQARGKALFNQKCGTCHQESLKGTSDYPPLVGESFWLNWEPYTAFNLYDQIRTTMPADAPSSLTPAEYTDIVSYIVGMNGLTLAAPLPSDVDGLKKVSLKK